MEIHTVETYFSCDTVSYSDHKQISFICLFINIFIISDARSYHVVWPQKCVSIVPHFSQSWGYDVRGHIELKAVLLFILLCKNMNIWSFRIVIMLSTKYTNFFAQFLRNLCYSFKTIWMITLIWFTVKSNDENSKRVRIPWKRRIFCGWVYIFVLLENKLLLWA
jgi:hypothetical protein